MENSIFEKKTQDKKATVVEQVVYPDKVIYSLVGLKTKTYIDPDKGTVDVRQEIPAVVTIKPYYSYLKNGSVVEMKYIDKQKPTVSLNGALVDNYKPLEIRGGSITLHPATNVEDRDKWLHMKDHPNNRSNPNRNRDDVVVFEEVNTEIKTKDTLKANKTQFEAEKLVYEFSEEKLRNVYRLFEPINEKPILQLDTDIMTARLIDEARNNTEEFVRKVKDPATYIELVIKCAEDEGVDLIVHNDKQNAWLWKNDNQIIAQTTSEAVRYSELIAYFRTDSGKKSFSSIEAKLKELKFI